MNQQRKDEIDRLINIYLNGLTSVNNDAGWKSVNLIGLLIEYKGLIPKGTGNDQSNLTSIIGIKDLRTQHAEYGAIAGAMINLQIDNSMAAYALCAKTFYAGLVPKEIDTKERSFRNEDRARIIGQNISTFKRNVQLGYILLDRELQRGEIHHYARKAAV